MLILLIFVWRSDRDEIEDMENFLAEVTKVLKVPIMIDSTDENVMERALTYIQGKAVINSINLEDGEERFKSDTASSEVWCRYSCRNN